MQTQSPQYQSKDFFITAGPRGWAATVAAAVLTPLAGLAAAIYAGGRLDFYECLIGGVPLSLLPAYAIHARARRKFKGAMLKKIDGMYQEDLKNSPGRAVVRYRLFDGDKECKESERLYKEYLAAVSSDG